jgi:hypothetical protein
MGEIDLDREAVVQKMKMMYYPFVHPPRPVLWQALLYWDELTSITPEDGYQFRHDLVVLRDLGLYQPTHADDLPARARANLVSDLRQVVEELPGEDLVPIPGPLGPDNRVYWGKLPYEAEHDLVEIGALVPQEDMLRASPVLLSRLMVVLAKHLAAAARGVIRSLTRLPPIRSPSRRWDPICGTGAAGSCRSAICCRYQPPMYR